MRDKIKNLFNNKIWTLDLSNSSKGYVNLVTIVKAIRLTFSQFTQNRLGFQSVAISYSTTLAIIPGLAILFAVTNGLGISDKIYDILIKIFPFNSEIVNLVMSKADTLLELAMSGGVGFISAVAFLWVLLLMMFQIERVFNSVWGIRKIPRKAYKRLGYYIIIMLLSPFVILTFGASFVYYMNLPSLFGIDISELRVVTVLIAYLILYIISTFTISAMYKFIPAVKVNYRCAFEASAITSIIFLLFQYLYLETQVFVGRINSVYGVLAAIPLFLIWLNISWQIIMYGASLTYGLQTLKTKV